LLWKVADKKEEREEEEEEEQEKQEEQKKKQEEQEEEDIFWGQKWIYGVFVVTAQKSLLLQQLLTKLVETYWELLCLLLLLLFQQLLTKLIETSACHACTLGFMRQRRWWV
jgi:hypothetical protein